jgi:Circularly permutated YpsA SLOG family
LPLRRVVSGGQTGVDRAALDVAADLGFEAGGWVPKGRRAEDGTIPDRYAVLETPSRDYEQRTEWNVRDTDATLVLTTGRLEGGTAATLELAHRMEKPVFVVDLLQPRNLGTILYWLEYEKVSALNVAGPRESKVPGIRAMAMEFLKDLLIAVKGA